MKKDKNNKGPICEAAFCTQPAINRYDVNGKGDMMWLCQRHLHRIK